jgi:transcriptional regulator with XRE-family HTH domain
MTSFRFDIGADARRASRFIGRVRSQLLQAFVEQERDSGITTQNLAKKLKMRRSDLARLLGGEDRLTLRAIAEIAGALDREITFELRPVAVAPGQNYLTETSTVASGRTLSAGAPNTTNSTLPSSPLRTRSAYRPDNPKSNY